MGIILWSNNLSLNIDILLYVHACIYTSKGEHSNIIGQSSINIFNKLINNKHVSIDKHLANNSSIFYL